MSKQKSKAPRPAQKLAVGYMRVSTDDQIKGASLGAQREKIAQWAKLFDAELLKVFSDPGRSGRSRSKRPGLAAALALASERKATLVVHDVDRLARNTEEAIQMCRELVDAGGNLASVREHLDTTSAFGRWAFRALASNAELESDRIGERIRTALEHKRLQRKRWWGSRRPYGWRVSADKTHAIQVRSEQAVIAKMRRWRREGRGYELVAQRLNRLGVKTTSGKKTWLRMTVYRILKIDERMRSLKRLG